MHWASARPAGRQAAAADLEIIAVEEEWARRELPVGIRNLVMAALFLWMCCVRFEHMQSSIVLLEWEQARLPVVYVSFHPSRP